MGQGHARQNSLGRFNRLSASGAGRQENPMVDGESPKLYECSEDLTRILWDLRGYPKNLYIYIYVHTYIYICIIIYIIYIHRLDRWMDR